MIDKRKGGLGRPSSFFDPDPIFLRVALPHQIIYNIQRELPAADGIVELSRASAWQITAWNDRVGIFIRFHVKGLDMNKLKGLSGLLGLATLALLLFSVSGVPGEGTDGAVFAAGGGNWKNVTVLYLNDVKGKIDPCG